MNKKWYIAFLLILLSIISITFWWVYKINKIAEQISDNKFTNIILKSETVCFNNSGYLENNLTVQQIIMEEKKNVKLDQLYLTIYTKDLGQWHIKSLLGLILSYNNRVILKNAEINYQKEDQEKIMIKTDELFYSPQNLLIFTDKEVTLYRDDLIIKSVGMQVDLNREKITLFKIIGGN